MAEPFELDVLAGVTDLYVSDIHGEYETFSRILGQRRDARLHVVGDVYDRGPAPDLVMDALRGCGQVDVQWGNHDILWMGASLGQPGCVANVVRICARYGNLSVLEDTYGIDLEPLKAFAREAYADDPCVAFGPKGAAGLDAGQRELCARVQKAMAFIQFKVEHRSIAENPSFCLEGRDLLHRIDYEAGTVELDGAVHELVDAVFPTVDPHDPYRLTAAEEDVLSHLERAFAGNGRLREHIAVFLEKGGLYRICGDKLLFHACVPLNPNGSLMEVELFGETLKGRALFDAVDAHVRAAFSAESPEARKRGRDLLWYLWLGKGSPLFAKSKMATFELYLVADKEARAEHKNAFYSLLDDRRAIGGIFEDFGMNPDDSRIICGHVPVKVKDGQDPVKCGGRVLVIDGGMSHAYRASTGIAGFVLADGADGVKLGTLGVSDGSDSALTCTWRDVPPEA